MKKLGFTLAEVLIVMGVIGIVATLTLPTLFSNYEKAQVATSLSKAINTLETANEQIMHEKGVSTLTQINNMHYIDGILSQIITFSQDKNGWKQTKDGISFNDSSPWVCQIHDSLSASYYTYCYKYGYETNNDSVRKQFLQENGYGGNYFIVTIDINGPKGKNDWGVDRFLVWVDSKGTVIPVGGSLWYYYRTGGGDFYTAADSETWKGKCNKNTVTNKYYCAGNIVDNGYKVEYEF